MIMTNFSWIFDHKGSFPNLFFKCFKQSEMKNAQMQDDFTVTQDEIIVIHLESKF